MSGIKSVKDSFDFKWSIYSGSSSPLPLWSYERGGTLLRADYTPDPLSSSTDYIRFLLEITKIDPRWLRGKLVLDLGCGIGWASYALLMLGARVVSLDLSLSSVKMAHSLLDKAFDGSVVQADIYHLPLRHDVFDCSIALGVLHHTPNTRTALGFVSEVTKAGGVLVLHVYEKQNPCRTLLTNLLRWIIQRYPEIIQYRLIERYLVCDSRASGLKRRLYAFIGLFIMIAADPVGGFDAYSPRYNNVQSLPELLSWLRQAKFAGVEILSERKNLRFHDRLLRGDYGGAIYAKSHKAGSRVTR